METTFEKVEELADNIREYVNNRISSAKWDAAEKSSEVIGNITARIVIAVLVLLFLIFTGLALAEWMNGLAGSTWLGFLIMGGIWCMLSVIAWIDRERIFKLQVMNSMLDQLFRQDEKE